MKYAEASGNEQHLIPPDKLIATNEQPERQREQTTNWLLKAFLQLNSFQDLWLLNYFVEFSPLFLLLFFFFFFIRGWILEFNLICQQRFFFCVLVETFLFAFFVIFFEAVRVFFGWERDFKIRFFLMFGTRVLGGLECWYMLFANLEGNKNKSNWSILKPCEVLKIVSRQ